MPAKHSGISAKFLNFLLLLCGGTAAVAAPTYSIVENIMPSSYVTSSYKHNAGIGYSSFEPYGFYQTDFPSMNEAGDFVGMANNHAAVWKRNGAMIDLGIAGCGATVSFCGSHGSGINDLGFVVGASNVASGFNVYYQQGHQWVNGTVRGVYTGGQSDTLDINNRGDKVTTGIQASDYLKHGFVKSYTGIDYKIGNDATQPSTAVAVSPAGLVTGAIDINQTGANWRAYLFDYSQVNNVPPAGAGYPVKILETLGGDYGAGYDVNDSADVVGESATSIGYVHATAWFAGNVTANDLGTLGGTSSVARSINKHRQIVGFSLDSSGQYRAFLWENGVMYDLATLIPNNNGWTIVDAYKITDRGHILTRAMRNGGYAYVLLDSGNGWAVPHMSDTTPEVSIAKLESMGSSSYDYRNGKDKVIAVETDAQGNIYRVGVTGTADMDYDPGPGVMNGVIGTDSPWGNNIYIQKLGPDGQLLWVKQIVRSRGWSYLDIERLLVDQTNGDFYLIVRNADSSTSWDLDPSSGTALIRGSTFYPDIDIAKYDPNGNFIRRARVQRPDYTSIFYGGAAIDQRGTVYMAASESSSWGGTKQYIIKMAATGGAMIKTELRGIPRIVKIGIGFNPSLGSRDTLYLVGIADGTFDFDPGPGVESRTLTKGLFLTGYSLDLSFLWVSTISNVDINWGNYFALSHFLSTDKVGNVYFTYKNYLDQHIKLVKYTDLGTRQWSTTVVNNVTDLRTDNDGVYVAGAAEYGGNLSVTKLDIHYPGSFMTKFSPGGVYLWGVSLNGASEALLSINNPMNLGLHGMFSGAIKAPTATIPGITAKGPWAYDQDIYSAFYQRRIP